MRVIYSIYYFKRGKKACIWLMHPSSCFSFLLTYLSLKTVIVLPLLSFSANEYYTTRWARCIYSSPDLSDMVYTDSTYFNKYLYIQFNSTIGRFVGFTEHGMRTADDWNNSTYLQQVKERVVFCKFSIASRESAAHVKSGKWLKTLF